MFNRFSSNLSPASVVGTWKAVNSVFVNGQRQTALAVVQFNPDGSFVEGVDVANQASTYLGRYNYDGQRIAFIIDSAAGAGPQPVPFHQPALSSTVVFDTPTTTRLNNDLTFAFESASVAPSDFVLPSANAPFTDRTFNSGFNSHSSFSPFTPTFGFNDHTPFF